MQVTCRTGRYMKNQTLPHQINIQQLYISGFKGLSFEGFQLQRHIPV